MRNVSLLCSAALLTASGAAMAGPSNDSESFSVDATVYVDAICELNPDGNHTYSTTLTPGQEIDTGPIGFSYGCNAPYTLELVAANGQLQNTEDGSVGIGYVIKYNGGDIGIGPGNKTAQLTSTTYQGLSDGMTNASGEVELSAPDTNDIVAGTYEENLTLTLSSNL